MDIGLIIQMGERKGERKGEKEDLLE